jgi:hypothetical protein
MVVNVKSAVRSVTSMNCTIGAIKIGVANVSTAEKPEMRIITGKGANV